MDLPREKRSLDPLGHALFSERVQLGLAYLGKALEIPKKDCTLKTKPNHWVITGVGSSEAHGKFLTYLINTHTNYTAEFWVLSQFIEQPKIDKGAGLIVFSQGLSSNAQLALKKKDTFSQCVLFSAVSHTTENKEKRTLLLKLGEEGVQHVQCTPDNEYTLLIRVAGPLTGYLTCLQWVTQTLEGTMPEQPQSLFETLAAARKVGRELANKELLTQINKGSVILTQGPTSLFSQNLGYKLTEGLFTQQPQLCDILSFSHGPFQALCNQLTHAFVLLGSSSHERLLEKKAIPLLEHCTSSYYSYQSQLPAPWTIFEYEMFFNGLIEGLLPLSSADQINWPGKGEDGSLYDLSDLA